MTTEQIPNQQQISEFIEPLLKPDPNRRVMFPIKYPDIFEMYKKQIACFWTVEEIKLADDQPYWDALTADERFYISMILGFFASSDGLVNENIVANFSDEIQVCEARAFYGFQVAMENIHNETYSLLIDTYIKNQREKEMLLKAVEYFPSIAAKTEWAERWMRKNTGKDGLTITPFAKEATGKETSFAQRLVAFACVEGIFFSGAFCSIFWLKKRGLLPGLTFSNELISRDEALHCEFAVLLYKKLVNRLPQETVHAIISSAVTVEIGFICNALPCRLIGMNSDLMSEYIKYCADRLCVQLGYEKIYHISTCPFPWMEMISMEGKTNFFDKQVSDYSLAEKAECDPNAFLCTDMEF